jgi:hypothetical protein
MNWSLRGTGEFSPVAGRPCVTEDDQANYLVRYFVICLATGLVERIYWWQLVAPGYGLVDSRDTPWRRRPSYFAMAAMVRLLEGSRFIGKAPDMNAEIFLFRKGEEEFAVCWSRTGEVGHRFSRRPVSILGRDGKERKIPPDRIRIEETPQYVFFR